MPYGSTERTIPATVSPGENRAAFSSQVPSSSLWLRVMRPVPLSTALTTARMSIPTEKRSRGWSMRETEIASIGSRATMPQPMSAKAPKLSRWVTRASITSPGLSLEIRSSRHFCWAARRERTAVTVPSSFFSKPVTRKQTGRLTLDRMAMSRTVPSRIPSAPSARGMTPFMPPKSTQRLCVLSQTTARASRIRPSRQASFSEEKFCRAARFSWVSIFHPSGS